MRQNFLKAIAPVATLLLLAACTDDIANSLFGSGDAINLSGDINQEYVTRANDSGFADGDRMGIFIVDYDGSTPGALSESGNRATNVDYSYDASTQRWSGSTTVRWKDTYTAVDIYGYYPYENGIESITAHTFTVEDDQSSEGGSGDMSGYEKSDFLWVKKSNISPTSETIYLNYSHRLSGFKVVLQQGSGFEGEEWNKVERIVTIDNTLRSATIDMTTGVATATGSVDKSIIASPQGNDTYRAVTIPQLINSGTKLISVTVDGTSYSYTHNEALKLTQGKLYTFTLKVDKKESGDYSLSLVSQEVGTWENDNSSHDFESAAYTIIDCPTEGTLEQCIAKSGKTASDIKNLKITGRLIDEDFEFIRNNISGLQALNIGEVTVQAKDIGWFDDDALKYIPEKFKDKDVYDNVLPYQALYKMSYLQHIVLPSSVEGLGRMSLTGIGLAYNTTLVIPNKVCFLGSGALMDIKQGNIVLPDSLVFVGSCALQDNSCYFQYNLTNELKYIGSDAFGCYNGNVSHCYGTFKIPEQIEYLGEGAFHNFGEDLMGDIVIPTTIKEIKKSTFWNMHFVNGTNITMHDGITSIGKSSFAGISFNNRVIWSKGLLIIGSNAFESCDFKGGMEQLPNISSIGSRAFYGCKNLPEDFSIPESLSELPNTCFMGSSIKALTIPSNIETIGEEAFYYCQNLKEVSIGEIVTDIGNSAFAYNEALENVRSLNTEPPTLGSDFPFEGCNFDHLILEVPEQSVGKYRNASGWSKFKYITAYHELALSVSSISCLDKGLSREVIVRSEGAWEVASCPSWCHVSQSSATGRTTDITVSVDATSAARQGEIVFQLKESGYKTTCSVNQYVASTAEDKEIVLQTATAGATPVNVFIVGDGFTAESIADGTYLSTMKEQVEDFFSIEPYKTYRNYFTVRTSLAVSAEKGVSSAQTLVENKFNSTYDPWGVGYRCDYDKLRSYASSISSSIDEKALIIVVMNQNTFGGNAHIEDDGCTIALTSVCSDGIYPYDARGLVQHYAGGMGFGRLAAEYIEHFDFLKACTCPRCNRISEYYAGRAKGWYGNVSLSGSASTVPWKHLIFDSRFSKYVDVYEGAYYHSRGCYKSEPQSCMDSYIHYYNAISRELIVRRIMQLAGKTFNFDDFANKDSWEGRPE